MTTQQKTAINVWHAIARRWWWLIFSLVIVAAIGIYTANRSTSVVPNTGSTSATQLDPAAERVMDYLRDDKSVQDRTLPVDREHPNWPTQMLVQSTATTGKLPVDREHPNWPHR